MSSSSSSSSSSFGLAPKLNAGQHQSRARPRVFPFTTPGCCAARLDAGSGHVKPTWIWIIQNLQTSCSSWLMMKET